MMKCQFSYIEQGDPVSLDQFSNDHSDNDVAGYQTYIDNCFAGLLQVNSSTFLGFILMLILMPTG